jgi:hypothetical protein
MLIGFAGLKSSGKSTAAAYLKNHFKFNEISFADPIRKFLIEQIGLSQTDIEEDKEKPCDKLGGRTPRFVMQTLGTEWGRNMIWQDLWVERFRRCALVHLKEGKSVVAADVRFQNEIDTIQALHGKVFWIMRYDRSAAHDKHVSENSIRASDCDGVIFNRRTIADFHSDLENELFHINRKTVVRAPLIPPEIFRPAAPPPSTPAPTPIDPEDETPF